MMWKLGSEIATSIGPAKLVMVAFVASPSFKGAQSLELYQTNDGKSFLWMSEGERQTNILCSSSQDEAIKGLRECFQYPVKITFFPDQEEG